MTSRPLGKNLPVNLTPADLMSTKILPPISASDSAQKQEKYVNATKAIADAISSNQLHIELIWIKSPATVTRLDKVVSSSEIKLASGDLITNVVEAIFNGTDAKRLQAGKKSWRPTSKTKQRGKIAQPQTLPVLSENSMLLVTEVAEELVRKLLHKCLIFQDKTTTEGQIGAATSVVPESQYERLFSIIMKSVTDILAGKLNLPNENVIASTKVLPKHQTLKTEMSTSDLMPETAVRLEKPAATTEIAVKGKSTYLEETRLTSDVASQKYPGKIYMGPEIIIKKLPKRRRLSLSKIVISPTKSLSSESQKLGKKPEHLPEAIPKSKKPVTTKKNLSRKSSFNQNVDRLPLFHKIKEIKVIKDEKTEKIAVHSKPAHKPTELDNKPLQETLDNKSASHARDSKDNKTIQESFDLLDDRLVRLLTAQLKCEISEMVSTQAKVGADTTRTSETDKPDVVNDTCRDLIPGDTSATVMDHIKKLIGLSLHSLEQKPETKKQQICANKSTETTNAAGEFTECFVKLFNEMTGSVSQSCKLGLTSPDFLNAIYYEIKKSLACYREQICESCQVAKHIELPSEGKRHISTLGDQVTNRLHEILQTKTEMLASSCKDVTEQKTTETAKLMKEELIKFALQQLLSDEKFSQEITNIITEERKVISPPASNLTSIVSPEVSNDIVLKMIAILLDKVDSSLSFVPLQDEVNDVSQELVNAIIGEVEKKYACTDSLEVDLCRDESLAEPITKKTVQIICFARMLTTINFVSRVTEQVKKILCLKPIMQNQVVLKTPVKHKEICLEFGTEPVASYFNLISVDLVRFVLERIKKSISCSASSNDTQFYQSQTTSSEISVFDTSSKDTAAPTISSGQSSCSSKASKKRISFSLPQESICEKIYLSSISPIIDSVAEEMPDDVCHYTPGISGLTKMSEALVENIVGAVLTSEPSNEETGVCQFVKTPVSLDEDVASKLVQYILDEKKKCQVTDTVFSESSESFSDQRAEKIVSGTIEEIGPSYFLPQDDSGEKQIYREEETICTCHYQDIKICPEPEQTENIHVVMQPHVVKSITDYVKQSVYQTQLDQLCGSQEEDAFKNDTTRQELQDFFLEQVTKDNIQKVIECKKQTPFIGKPQSEWVPLEEVKSKENVYTADSSLECDSVCPLTRKETIVSWISSPPVCDKKLDDESFVSVDQLHKMLCMEGEKSMARVTDSILQAPMVEPAQMTKMSPLHLLSDTVMSNRFQELESSFKQPCVCQFKPMEADICKLPDEQRSSLLQFSDNENICAMTAFEAPASETMGPYISTCTCPLHSRGRKLSVCSSSTGSSEAESLVQTALCNIWADVPYEKQLGSEASEHDKAHSSESSIVLDDLSEELLTDALVSIFSNMIDSLLQESSDKTSPSSSQLNLLSENIVSDVMQGLKQSPVSSYSSVFIPSSSDSSGKDTSPQGMFKKDNLRKQTLDDPQVSGKKGPSGKIAQKRAEKEISSASTVADDASVSTVSRDADHLVQEVLNDISSKHHKDTYSSKLLQREKVQQKRATESAVSSESSSSLNELVGGLSKEDFATIYSYVTDILLHKSFAKPHHRKTRSQSSLLSEKMVADILQDLQTSPEVTSSSSYKPSMEEASISNDIAAELPVLAIEAAHEGLQTSDLSSGETSTTPSEAEDLVHIALNDLSITDFLKIDGEISVNIIPHMNKTEFRLNPELIGKHLSVISIKTEPIEVLEQITLLQTGQDLKEIRKASIANTAMPTMAMQDRRVSFERSGGSLRRGSLDDLGRLDVKRNEVR